MKKILKNLIFFVVCFSVLLGVSVYKSHACGSSHYFTLSAVDPLVNGSFAGSSKAKLTVNNHVSGATYKFVWSKVKSDGSEDWSEWGVISDFSSATTRTFYLPNTTGKIKITMDRKLNGTTVSGICKQDYNLPTTVGAQYHSVYTAFKTLPTSVKGETNWSSPTFIFNHANDKQLEKRNGYWIWHGDYGLQAIFSDTFIVYKNYTTINGVPYDAKLQICAVTSYLGVSGQYIGFRGADNTIANVSDLSDVQFEVSLYKHSDLGTNSKTSDISNAAYKYYTNDTNKIVLKDIYIPVLDLDGDTVYKGGSGEMLKFWDIDDVYSGEPGFDIQSVRNSVGTFYGLRFNKTTGAFCSHWTTDATNQIGYYNGATYNGDLYSNGGKVNGASAFFKDPTNNVIRGQFRNDWYDYECQIYFTFKQYDVTYKATNGSITAVTGGTKNSDGTWGSKMFSRYNLESVTVKPNTGYKFSHWLYNGKQYTDAQRKAIATTSDMTWTAVCVPINYSVKYNGNNSTTGTMTASSHTYDTAKTLTANVFTKTGYRFNGWNTKADGTGTSYANSASVKNLSATDGAVVNLYAKWSANTYTVKYNGNTNTSGTTADSSHTYDTAKALTANGYSKTGYTFTGWNTKADGTGTAYTSGASVKNLTATHSDTITLYAQWKPINYSVQYSGNTNTGGSMSDSEHTYDVSKGLNENKYLKDGYTFSHWLHGSNKYQDKQIVVNLTTTADAVVNIIAQWSANKYTIKYDGNGATSGTTNDSIHTYDTITNLRDNGFSRVGHTYLGWNTKPDGSGTTYLDAAPIKNLTKTANDVITLYAQWKPYKYTVMYDGNGATGGTTSDTEHTYGIPQPLSKPGYYKENGYIFIGWNTKADGSGTMYGSYENQGMESVKNLTATDGATVTLYAQWKQVLKISSKKNFYFKDSTVSIGDIAKNDIAIDDRDGDISVKTVITEITYPDGTVVQNPTEFDTSKEGIVKLRYFIENSYNITAWIDNEVHIVGFGSDLTVDDDNIKIYSRYISNEDLYDGVNAMDTLDIKSIWKNVAYKNIILSSRNTTDVLPEYNYINDTTFIESLQ